MSYSLRNLPKDLAFTSSGLCLDFGCDVLKYLQSWESSAICACKYANARAKRLCQVCLMLKDRHVVPAAFATAVAQGRAVLVGGM